MPLARDIDDFVFDGTPINETLVRDLASGNFIAHRREAVLIGGTGTGKTHLAVAIARACIRGQRPRPLLQRRRPRQQTRGRDTGGPPGPHGRRPDAQDFIVLDELGYLPFA